MNAIKNFLNDEGGQDMVEYSLLLVLLGGAAIFILTQMGVSISAIFGKVATKLEAANKAIS